MEIGRNMRLSVCVVFVLLTLTALLTGLSSGLECEGAADTSCNAFTALEISTSGGQCEGSASADCEVRLPGVSHVGMLNGGMVVHERGCCGLQAVGKSQSRFKEAFDEWWGQGDDACNEEFIDVAATAVAVATAEVWASAAAKVSCTGYGFACGWSITNGNAFALGFAEALAVAAAEASAGIGASALCFADIRAVSSVLATAAADAQAEACVDGEGTTESFQEGYVNSVKAAVADAFASATASACVGGECSGCSTKFDPH